MMEKSLYIALVTPFAWSIPAAVNHHIGELARELKRQGHRPVIVTSSDDPADTKRMRALFRRSRGQLVELLEEYRSGGPPDELLLPHSDDGPLDQTAAIAVIPVGLSFPVRLNRGVASIGLPLDVTSRLEKLMLAGDFDLLHVHEPMAPSLSFTALREARSPVVATFHLTPVGAAAYELGQAVLDRFFSRLDARVVTFAEGRQMMAELYPAGYEVVPCGTSMVPQDDTTEPETRDTQTGLYVYRGDDRRSYRALIRMLIQDFPASLDRMVVALHRPSVKRWLPRAIPRRLRSRIVLHEFESTAELAPLYQTAAVTILPYLGGEWLCTSIAEAVVSGCPFVGPDLPPVQEHLNDERQGAVFSPGDAGSLEAAVQKALCPPATASEVIAKKAQADSVALTMPRLAARLVDVYRETLEATSERNGSGLKTPVAGRSLHIRGIGQEPIRRRARHGVLNKTRADWINADLHVHSCYSHDCTSSIDSILETAREVGLGAIAIADHNEIDGALLARDLAEGDPFVIVAEEINTSEGEVIGLFLEELIPKGLTFDRTLSLIKEQGGLVYIPHPFDALRMTPSYRTLVDNLHRIDVIEIYNAKVALASFNLSAERFASKYNIVAGAGSDAHVLQALGTALLHMPRFHDATSFLAALWEADIIARHKNLIYLQSLKLLQTTLDRVLPVE